MLQYLEELAVSLNNLVIEVSPKNTAELTLREQSIGEIRGLRQLQKYILARQEELKQYIQQDNAQDSHSTL